MTINSLGGPGFPIFMPAPAPTPFQSPEQQGNPKQHRFLDMLNGGGPNGAPAFGPDGQPDPNALLAPDAAAAPAAVGGSFGDGATMAVGPDGLPVGNGPADPLGGPGSGFRGKFSGQVGGSFGDGFRGKFADQVGGSFGDGFRGKFADQVGGANGGDAAAALDATQPLGAHSGCDAPGMKSQLTSALSGGGAVGGASGGGATDALGGVTALPGQSQLTSQLMSLMTMLTQLIAQLAAQSQQPVAGGGAAQSANQNPKQMMNMDMSAFTSNPKLL